MRVTSNRAPQSHQAAAGKGWFLLGVLVALVLALCGGAAKAQDRLRIITGGDYPPFYFADTAGNPAGFDVDISKALCAAIGTRCDFVDLPFAENLAALLAGQGDMVVSSLAITEERKKLVAFTNRYYRTPMQFVARRGFDRPIAVEGLRGLRVGVAGNSSHESYVRHTFGAVIDVQLFPGSQDEMTAALLAHRVDLILSDLLAMWKVVTSAEGQGLEFVGAPIFVDDEIGIAVRKEDEALRQKLNLAIARIRLDGTYQAINAKYFPFSIY